MKHVNFAYFSVSIPSPNTLYFFCKKSGFREITLLPPKTLVPRQLIHFVSCDDPKACELHLLVMFQHFQILKNNICIGTK